MVLSNCAFLPNQQHKWATRYYNFKCNSFCMRIVMTCRVSS